MFVLFLAATLAASFDQVRVEAAAAVDAKILPGVAILALEGGQIHEAYLGSASDKTPVDATTVFEIGSITKTMTALVLAQMVEAGKVRLDDRIGQLVDWELSPALAKVTLLELATHTSGLSRLPTSLAALRSAFGNPRDPYAAYAKSDFLADLRTAKLSEKTYAYSNWGFAILGEVLAARAGRAYAALVSENVFAPWKLVNSYLALPAGIALAQGHDERGKPTPSWSAGMFGPAGMVKMTGRDLLSYLTQTLALEGTTADRLLGVHGDAGHGKIALGWHIKDGHVHWHNGGTGGFRSFAGFDRNAGTAIVVLTNTSIDIDRLGARFFGPVKNPVVEASSTVVSDAVLAVLLSLFAFALWRCQFASYWRELSRAWWRPRSIASEGLRFLLPPVVRPVAASRVEAGVLVVACVVVALQFALEVGWNVTGISVKLAALAVMGTSALLLWRARAMPWTGKQAWRRMPSSLWWLGITLWP